MTHISKIFIKLFDNENEMVSFRKDLVTTQMKPVIGMSVSVGTKIHYVKDVFFDGLNTEFFVELEDHITSNLEELKIKYEDNGWAPSITIKECKDDFIKRLCSGASILEMKILGLRTLTDNGFYPEIIAEFIRKSKIQSKDNCILLLCKCGFGDKEITDLSDILTVLSNSKTNTQESTLIMRKIEEKLNCDEI